MEDVLAKFFLAAKRLNAVIFLQQPFHLEVEANKIV